MKVTINKNTVSKIKLVAKETGYTFEETVNYMLSIQLAVLALPVEDREIILKIYDKAFDDN